MHLPKLLKSINKKIQKFWKKEIPSTQNPDMYGTEYPRYKFKKCFINQVIINANEALRFNESANGLQTKGSENHETYTRDLSTSVSEEQIRSETLEINNKDSFEGSGLNADTCTKDINESYNVKDGVQESNDQQTSSVFDCCSSGCLQRGMAAWSQHKVIPSGAGFIGQPQKCRKVIEADSEAMKADSEKITISSEIKYFICLVSANDISYEYYDVNINDMNDLHDTNGLNDLTFVKMSSHINQQHNIEVVGVDDLCTPDSETYVKSTSPVSYSGKTSCMVSQQLGSVEEDKLQAKEILNKEMMDIPRNHKTFSNIGSPFTEYESVEIVTANFSSTIEHPEQIETLKYPEFTMDIPRNNRTSSNNTSRSVQAMSLQTDNFSNSLKTTAMIDKLKCPEFGSDSEEPYTSTDTDSSSNISILSSGSCYQVPSMFASSSTNLSTLYSTSESYQVLSGASVLASSSTNILMLNSISKSSTNGKWNVNSSEQEKSKNCFSNLSSTAIDKAVTELSVIPSDLDCNCCVVDQTWEASDLDIKCYGMFNPLTLYDPETYPTNYDPARINASSHVLSNQFGESFTYTRRISDVLTLRSDHLLEDEECRTECILDDNILMTQVNGHNEIHECGCSHSEIRAVIMDSKDCDSRQRKFVISSYVSDHYSVHCSNYNKLSVLNGIFYWSHHILHNTVIVICYIYIIVILNNYTNIKFGIVDECSESTSGWLLSGEHSKISFMRLVVLSNDKSLGKLIKKSLNERWMSPEQHETKVHNNECFLSRVPHSEVSGCSASGAQINDDRQNRIVSSFCNNCKSKDQHGFKPDGFGSGRKKTVSSIEELPNQFVELSHTSLDSGIESGFDNSITFSDEGSGTMMDVIRKDLPLDSLKPLLDNNLRYSKNCSRFLLHSYFLLCLKDPMLRWILVENESIERAKSVVREIHINGSHIDLFVLERYFNMLESRQPTMEEQMQFEWLRFASFGTYHGNGNALALARNGFYHDTSEGPNATRCIYCGATHSMWESFDNIAVEHQRMSPSCPFLNHARDEANIPIAQNIEQTMPATGVTSATSSVVSSASAIASVTVADMPRSSVSQARTEGVSNHDERTPYQSIIQQPTEEPENRESEMVVPPSFIQTFGFTGSSYSSVIAPGVNNVAEGARTNVSVQSSTTPMGPANVASTLSDLRLGPGNGTADPTAGVVVTSPKHPDYRTLESRTNSYRGWPVYLDQTPRQMAEAGFFFVGVSDFTRCFACGGGLRNWEPGDDPVLEHTRWFPRCEYINKLKGERYVQAVERRHREHMAERQRRQNEIAQERRAVGQRPPDVMNTQAGTVLREMGFSEAKIRQAIEAIQQTGLSTSDITPQQALTWILEDEEGRSSMTLQQVPVMTSTQSTPTNAPSIAASPMIQLQENIQQSSRTMAATTIMSANKTKTSTRQGDKNSAASPSTISKAASREDQASSRKQTDQKDISDGESKESTKKAGKKKKKKSERSASKFTDSLVSSAHGRPNIDEKSLQQENERLREMQTCKICMENSVNTTLLPCGHLVTCEPCAKRLAKCPICRKRITGTVKTFMS